MGVSFPRRDDIPAGPNGWPVEHVRRTPPDTDKGVTGNSSNKSKSKKANDSAAVEGVIVKKVVTVGKNQTEPLTNQCCMKIP